MAMSDIISESADDKAFFEADRASERVQPEPTPQPELQPVIQPEPPTPTEPEKQRFVPHEALHEERTKRQAISEELAKTKETIAKMEQRFQEMMRRFEEPKAAPEPDPETDPLEYIKAKGRQLDEMTRAQKEQDDYNSRLTAFRTRLDGFENDFRTATPDYDAAVKFAVEARQKELQLLGYADPGERSAVVQREIFDLATRCFQAGKNPAEVFYGYAKARGYAKADEASAPSAQEKVASLAAKQQMARSPSSANGAPPRNISIEDLSAMTDEEFDRNFQLWERT